MLTKKDITYLEGRFAMKQDLRDLEERIYQRIDGLDAKFVTKEEFNELKEKVQDLYRIVMDVFQMMKSLQEEMIAMRHEMKRFNDHLDQHDSTLHNHSYRIATLESRVLSM